MPEPSAEIGAVRPARITIEDPANRVHLDLGSSDLATEVDLLVRLGATELHRVESRVTMADPEGNEFCIDAM